MFLYLGGHLRPGIFYAVNDEDFYMSCPKHSQELTLKLVGQYLKMTRERGLVKTYLQNLIYIYT